MNFVRDFTFLVVLAAFATAERIVLSYDCDS